MYKTAVRLIFHSL